MKRVKAKSNSREWTSQTLSNIPLIGWRVLNVFVEKNKDKLESEEIKKALKGKLEKNALGGALGLFGKYRNREILLYPLIKKTPTNTVWEINPKYFPIIKEHIKKIKEYL